MQSVIWLSAEVKVEKIYDNRTWNVSNSLRSLVQNVSFDLLFEIGYQQFLNGIALKYMFVNILPPSGYFYQRKYFQTGAWNKWSVIENDLGGAGNNVDPKNAQPLTYMTLNTRVKLCQSNTHNTIFWSNCNHLAAVCSKHTPPHPWAKYWHVLNNSELHITSQSWITFRLISFITLGW